jgi:hypothetical protein
MILKTSLISFIRNHFPMKEKRLREDAVLQDKLQAQVALAQLGVLAEF